MARSVWAVGALLGSVGVLSTEAWADPNPAPDAPTQRRAAPQPQPQPPQPQPQDYSEPPPVMGGTGMGYNAPPPVGQAPPPVRPVYIRQPTQYQPPPPPPPPAPTESESMRPGFYIGGLLGGAAPVGGELAEYFSTGFGFGAEAGLVLRGGLSLRVEVGSRTHASQDLDGDAFTLIWYGVGARYYLIRTNVFHPFIDATFNGYSPVVPTTAGSSSGTTSGTGVMAGAGVGFLVDLIANTSLIANVRYDHPITNADGAAPTGGVLGFYGGITYHF